MARPRYVVEDAQFILDAIQTYTDAHQGVSPTVRELAAACFLSSTAMQHRLVQLEAAGYLEREPGKLRSIRVVHQRSKYDETD